MSMNLNTTKINVTNITPEVLYPILAKLFMENPQLVKNTCKKGGILNIVYPKVPNSGIHPRIVVEHIRTKEKPDGCFYDPATNRMIVRLFFNKETGLYTFFLLEDGENDTTKKYDTYCWEDEVFEAEPDKMPINVRSTEGLMNLHNLLNLMENDDEKRALCDDIRYELFGDFYLCKSKSDMRLSIEITQELFDLGLTHVIDEWVQTPNKNGVFDLTELVVGDRLIWTIKKSDNEEIKHSFYRCAKNVYEKSYEDLETPFEDINNHIK